MAVTESVQKPELYCELWRVDSEEHCGNQALELLTTLYAATPRVIYQERIDELRAP